MELQFRRICALAVFALAAVVVFVFPPQAEAQGDRQPPAQAPSVAARPGNVPARPRTPNDLKAARVERVPGVFDPVAPIARWRQELTCIADSPADVAGYRIVCSQASFLDFQIADCCIPGDHWQAKGKAWDLYPNTAVTTSPGPDSVYGLPARVYNYGGTTNNPKGLDVYLECTYLDGVNVFGAGAFILVSSDGNCSVTSDPSRRRIDRTP